MVLRDVYSIAPKKGGGGINKGKEFIRGGRRRRIEINKL